MSCERLNDYLAGELDDREEQAFRLHLPDCAACSEEVRFQQAIDGLLRQATACEAPHDLQSRLGRKMQTSPRRMRLATIGAVAIAASLMLIFAARPSRRPTDVPIGPMSTPDSDSTSQQAVASIVVDPSCDLLAVPRESTHPNVTIFWLYPTIKTAAPKATTPEDATNPRSES